MTPKHTPRLHSEDRTRTAGIPCADYNAPLPRFHSRPREDAVSSRMLRSRHLSRRVRPVALHATPGAGRPELRATRRAVLRRLRTPRALASPAALASSALHRTMAALTDNPPCPERVQYRAAAGIRKPATRDTGTALAMGPPTGRNTRRAARAFAGGQCRASHTGLPRKRQPAAEEPAPLQNEPNPCRAPAGAAPPAPVFAGSEYPASLDAVIPGARRDPCGSARPPVGASHRTRRRPGASLPRALGRPLQPPLSSLPPCRTNRIRHNPRRPAPLQGVDRREEGFGLRPKPPSGRLQPVKSGAPHPPPHSPARGPRSTPRTGCETNPIRLRPNRAPALQNEPNSPQRFLCQAHTMRVRPLFPDPPPGLRQADYEADPT